MYRVSANHIYDEEKGIAFKISNCEKGDSFMDNKQLETLTCIQKGLYETTKAVLPFDKRYRIKSFVLERPEGNIVIYHSPGLNEAMTDIQLLDGASCVLMNHEHESLGGTPNIDIPFWIHRDDVAAINQTVPIDGQFEQRETIADDLEVIPTPGHTSGTTMFLWDNDELQGPFCV